MKHKNYDLNDEIRKKIEIWIKNKAIVSYSEICENFNWKKTNGDSKSAQIKILEKNYEFKYIGSHSHKKFLFYGIKDKNLINNPLTQKGKYFSIDKIIMEKLNLIKNGTLNGSILNISQQLGIINFNFFYTKSNLDDVEVNLGYPKYFLVDFIEVINKRISKILERSLNRLEKLGYIELTKDIILKPMDSKFTKRAEKEDKENIDKIRKSTIKEIGYFSIEELIKDGKGFVYRNALEQKLKQNNIKFFYENYNIKRISRKAEKIDMDEHKNLINEFNLLFTDNCITNLENEIINLNYKEKYKKISLKTYFALNKFLIDCLIYNKSIYNLKNKTILENNIEINTSKLENGYMWMFLNNIYGNLYIKTYNENIK